MGRLTALEGLTQVENASYPLWENVDSYVFYYLERLDSLRISP